jgi:predicted N-acyltransferase
MAIQCQVFDSIAAIERAAWDALFPGEIETWDYYRAVEQAALPGFQWRYFTLWRDGQLLAAAPAFLTEYRLDTTVTGALKRWTERLARLLPWLMSLRLLCLGSPVSEICHVGLAAKASEAERAQLLARLLAELQEEATRVRAGLIAVKDAPEDSPIAQACQAPGQGYTKLPGMPVAVMPIDFADLEHYFERFSRVTRKDLKRKCRAAQGLRIELRHNIDDVIDQVMALYESTWQRSELRLEHLTPDYFRNVLSAMPGRACCILYWQDDTLLAFNLVLMDGTRMIDKFFGTDNQPRRINLYHVSWIENLRQCLAQGLSVFQPGQAFYAEKVRLGCRLDINWQFFRHRSRPINAVLRTISGVVRLDQLDPEISRLIARPK